MDEIGPVELFMIPQDTAFCLKTVTLPGATFAYLA
jgi:hypothetical protein